MVTLIAITIMKNIMIMIVIMMKTLIITIYIIMIITTDDDISCITTQSNTSYNSEFPTTR